MASPASFQTHPLHPMLILFSTGRDAQAGYGNHHSLWSIRLNSMGRVHEGEVNIARCE